MSVPKQRHTKGRRDRRRANIKVKPKNLVVCSHCSRMVVRHSVCSYCGYYKGNEVLDMAEKSKKKKSKKEKK